MTQLPTHGRPLILKRRMHHLGALAKVHRASAGQTWPEEMVHVFKAICSRASQCGYAAFVPDLHPGVSSWSRVVLGA
eukprot:5141532-Alexandrium_andersonii.AAC.1